MQFTAVVEYCSDTSLYVGHIPGLAGGHSQAKTLDELKQNLQEVSEMLLENGVPAFESQFVGTQQIIVNDVMLASTTAHV